MEYYNIENIVRVRVLDSMESHNWTFYSLKSATKYDFILNHTFWKRNQKTPIYHYMWGEGDYYTIDDIKEHLLEDEYFDESTKQVMAYPRVILFLADGSNTTINFKTFQSALEYANKLIGKSNNFIELDKI